MGLRTEIRRMLEAGQEDRAIIDELRCCAAVIEKVREQILFDAAVVNDDAERERRARVRRLTSSDVSELARRAGISPVTLSRVLMGCRVRPSSVALVQRALTPLGLLGLVPPTKKLPREGAH